MVIGLNESLSKITSFSEATINDIEIKEYIQDITNMIYTKCMILRHQQCIVIAEMKMTLKFDDPYQVIT